MCRFQLKSKNIYFFSPQLHHFLTQLSDVHVHESGNEGKTHRFLYIAQQTNVFMYSTFLSISCFFFQLVLDMNTVNENEAQSEMVRKKAWLAIITYAYVCVYVSRK